MPESPGDKAYPHPAKRPEPLSPALRRAEPGAPPYAELQALSNYSFLRGASHPDELVVRAAAAGCEAIAITDINTLAGIVRAHAAAKEVGIRFVVGCRLELEARRHEGTEARSEREGGKAKRDLAAGHSSSSPHSVPPCLRAFVPVSLLVYPTDRTSYGRLCRLLTLGKRRTEKGECSLTLDDVLAHQEGLLAVAAPAEGGEDDPGFLAALERLRGAFDGDRLSLAASALYGADDESRLARLAEVGERAGVPLVAVNDVHYHVPARRALQDVLVCIRHLCTIGEAGRRLLPNGERYIKGPAEMARLFARYPAALARTVEIARRARFSLDELRYEYPKEVCPGGRSAMAYLRELTWKGACERFACTEHSAHNEQERRKERRERQPQMTPMRTDRPHASTPGPSHLCPSGSSVASSSSPRLSPPLGEQTAKSLIPGDVVRRIEHEFEIIEALDYAKYFLTVQDIVLHARSLGILCQGRGAAANSAVCYCLGITAVDPTRVDMLFERFVSRERNEPPDIDIDFEHERREEVIQYIYGKYGRDRAALCAEVITYRGRSAIRDVGKAMGLSLDLVDRMARQLDWWDGGVVAEERVREMGLDPGDPGLRMTLELAREILGFPRHLSQHVGGFVITENKLEETVPIENAAMPDRTVIEWDKDDIESLGMLKVDCLGLGMLTAISKALVFVNSTQENTEDTEGRNTEEDREERGEEASTPARSAPALPLSPPLSSSALPSVSSVFSFPRPKLELHTVPPEDPEVYEMIGHADTVGIFQVESRAQMSMLPRLKPRCYYDLVIEVAIVRPGPIQGDMVHPYLRRRQGIDPVSYPSPEVERVLSRTLGVPLFQEQAMQLAVVAGGFTPGEADQLRRAIAAWKRAGAKITEFGRKLRAGMIANGYSPRYAEQVFTQIQGFSGYGFPESHAASFALLVYVSAWLKRYHPAAFTAALINSQPMGFYAPAQLVRDAREHGVEVRDVDVNFSGWECRLEEGSGKVAKWQSGKVRSEADPSSTVPLCHSATLPLQFLPSHLYGAGGPALRLGMRLVQNLGEAPARAIEEAVRAHGRFGTVVDLWRASRVPVAALRALARADAFRSMGLDRRAALWEIRDLRDERLPLFEGMSDVGCGMADVQSSGIESRPTSDIRHPTSDIALPPLPEDRHVLQDYATMGLSLRAHPVSFLRGELDRAGVTPSGVLKDEGRMPHGTPAAVAGIVLCRQRPGTASGIVFMTLEDETGIANLIIRPDVYARHRSAARHSACLIARGRVERQGEVVHVVVQEIEALEPGRAGDRLKVESRDFH